MHSSANRGSVANVARIVSGPSIGLPNGIQMNAPTRISTTAMMRRVRRRSHGFNAGAEIEPEPPLSPRGEGWVGVDVCMRPC